PHGALAQRGEQDSRRGREPERRAVVLGHVVAMEAEAVVSLGQPQPPLEVLGKRQPAVVDMVEHPEFHGWPLRWSLAASLAVHAPRASRNRPSGTRAALRSAPAQFARSGVTKRAIASTRPLA